MRPFLHHPPRGGKPGPDGVECVQQIARRVAAHVSHASECRQVVTPALHVFVSHRADGTHAEFVGEHDVARPFDPFRLARLERDPVLIHADRAAHPDLENARRLVDGSDQLCDLAANAVEVPLAADGDDGIVSEDRRHGLEDQIAMLFARRRAVPSVLILSRAGASLRLRRELNGVVQPQQHGLEE